MELRVDVGLKGMETEDVTWLERIVSGTVELASSEGVVGQGTVPGMESIVRPIHFRQ